MSLKTSSFSNFNELIYQLIENVDIIEKNLKLSVFFIVFNPLFWNIVARLEYSTHFLTKSLGGARNGCYAFALTIFSLGLARDFYFHKAIESHITFQCLENEFVKGTGIAMAIVGQILVLTSMYRLGIAATFLGDYFGITIDERVTSFPFNISNNPMYQGSFLSFLGSSLYYASPTGIFCSLLLKFVYSIALRFEEPFTAMVYSKQPLKNVESVKRD